MSLVMCGGFAVLIDLTQKGGYFTAETGLPLVGSIESPNLTTAIIPFLIGFGLFLGIASTKLTQNSVLQAAISVTAPIFTVLALLPDSDLGLKLEFWSGFGFQPTVTTMTTSVAVLALAKFSRSKSIENQKTAIRVLKSVAVITLIVYLPIFIQPPNGLLNFGDTSYHVVDELLAPYSGSFPYSDYSPQYTGVLGWFLFPLRALRLSGVQMMTVVIIACNILGLLLPLLASLIIKKLFPRLSFLLILAACTSTSFASGEFNGSSTMLKEFSYSARLVPILVTILVLVIHLGRNDEKGNKSSAVLGVVTAISMLNNADVGLAFAAIMLVVVAFLVSNHKMTTTSGRLVFGWFLGTVFLYCIVGAIVGKPFDFASYWGLRATSPRTLYSAFPLHAFGAHLLVMAISTAAIATGVQLMRKTDPRGNDTAKASIYLVSGGLLVAMLIRFAIRPIPQGIPGLLIPTFIPGAMLVIDSVNSFRSHLRARSIGSAFAVLMIATLPIGALWQYPNPADELLRISGDKYGRSDWSSTPGRVADGYSLEALNSKTLFIDKITSVAHSLPPNSRIGYFGIYGNTVQLLTSVHNVMGIPAPESLRFGDGQERLACHPLEVDSREFVLVYGSRFPCQGYVRDVEHSTNDIYVYRRI